MLCSNLKYSQILKLHLWNEIIIFCIVLEFQIFPSFNRRKRSVPFVEKNNGIIYFKTFRRYNFLANSTGNLQGYLDLSFVWGGFWSFLGLQLLDKLGFFLYRLYFYICTVYCFVQEEMPLKLIALFPKWVSTLTEQGVVSLILQMNWNPPYLKR